MQRDVGTGADSHGPSQAKGDAGRQETALPASTEHQATSLLPQGLRSPGKHPPAKGHQRQRHRAERLLAELAVRSLQSFKPSRCPCSGHTELSSRTNFYLESRWADLELTPAHLALC